MRLLNMLSIRTETASVFSLDISLRFSGSLLIKTRYPEAGM